MNPKARLPREISKIHQKEGMKTMMTKQKAENLLKLDIKIRQQELVFAMLQDQLEYLDKTYPEQCAEAWNHAYDMNLEKITALKNQIDNMEKLKNDTSIQEEDHSTNGIQRT